MSRSKLVILSIVCGGVITAGLIWASASIGNEKVSRVLLWHAAIPVYLVGEGPLLGHDEQGEPIHEGSPVGMLAGLVGLLMGVPIYSAASYLALLAITRSGSKKGDVESEAM